MDAPLPVRSTDELTFVAEEMPCPSCGKLGIDKLRSGIQGDVFTAICAHCRTPRTLRFVPPPRAAVPAFSLAAGAAPSSVLGAERFRAIADRELALAAKEPTAYATMADYTEARRHLVRGRTALVELAKFRTGDAALAGELAAAEALWKKYEAAKAKIEAKPGALARPTGLGQRLKAHRDWVQRGKKGDGQLEMQGESWDGLGMANAVLHAAVIEDTTLEAMDLSYAELVDARIRRSRLVRCNLTRVELDRAKIEDTDLAGSSMGLAFLRATEVNGGDWSRITAGRSTWTGARLGGVDLRDASLVDAILDDATFTRCDLRGADLGRDDATLHKLGYARGTRFVDCDLRGARLDGLRMARVTFERCRLDGLVGAPVVEGTVTVDGKAWDRS